MAYDFAAGTDRIIYGTQTYLNNLGPLTFSVWAQRDTAPAGEFPRIFSKDEKKFFVFFADLAGVEASYQFAIACSTTNHSKVAPSNSVPASSSTWVHLAATWDGTLTTGGSVLYKNGAAESSYATNTAGSGSVTSDSSGDLGVGNRSSGTFDRGIDGRLAELAIWNVNLTASEIASLAKGFKPTRVRPQSLVFVAPLIATSQEIKNATVGTVTGATVAAHPRVY